MKKIITTGLAALTLIAAIECAKDPISTPEKLERTTEVASVQGDTVFENFNLTKYQYIDPEPAETKPYLQRSTATYTEDTRGLFFGDGGPDRYKIDNSKGDRIVLPNMAGGIIRW